MNVQYREVEQLWFTAPYQVEVRKTRLPTLNPHQMLVETQCSAVSAGTEMLLYRGQIPSSMLLDSNISNFKKTSVFPVSYGYACVGEVVQVGSDVGSSWMGRRIFAFQPHASHFVIDESQALSIPDDIPNERAIFFANTETAVSLLQDGAPLVGERIAVLGMGIVGLLLLNLLAKFPLRELVAYERTDMRRAVALKLGATKVIKNFSEMPQQKDFDLIYELTGVPEALNDAIRISGFSSRIIVGSWYGTKTSAICLGEEAHRNHLTLKTSQVSTIPPGLSGRWDKARRFDTTWALLREIEPEKWISHRVPLVDAVDFYRQIDSCSEHFLQTIFTYRV